MAGLRGNQAWLMFAKQTGKGVTPVPAATNAYRVPFSGGNIAPVRSFGNLAETDANRDQGVSYVSSGGVEGTPECYVRDSSLGALLQAVLGTSAPTGTTPNFTHTITPANTVPYVTFWKDLSDTLYERYNDCFVSSLTVRAAAGEPLAASFAVNGLSANQVAAADTAIAAGLGATPTVPLQSGYVYNYNDATVQLAGGTTALVGSFELTIDNNVTRQQTDSFVPYDVVVGQRQVSLSFDLIFETLGEYNKFHYGSAAPTLTGLGAPQSNAIYTTSADFQFDNGANNQIKFTLPTIAYEELSPEPNPGGDPITVSVRAVAQRPSSGNIITAVVKNQVTSY